MKITTILIVALIATAHAQTTISGKVTDENNVALPFASISLQDTYDGATSDSEGNFHFTTDETGNRNLRVTYTGYKEAQQSVHLEGKALIFTIQLEETINALEAVTVTAGMFTAGDQSRRTLFRPLDIATTAGATADIAGALNTLPGTQKVGESGQLFVRGGDGRETRTFIDGLAVLDPYRASAPNTPSRGRFLPFMFSGTSFSTGGYSAEYGQALSSALVLDSRDRSEITRTDIGLLSVGGDIAHTQAWNRGSATGKVQYTNISPYTSLVKQAVDWITPPVSAEGQLAFRQQVSKNGLLKLYGNFNDSHFSLLNHDIDEPHQTFSYDQRNQYRYGNGSYKTTLNENWMVRSGVSYTVVRNSFTTAGQDAVQEESGLHSKAVVEGSLSDKVELKAGVENLQRSFEQAGPDETGLNLRESITATFAEADVYTSNRFVTRGGFRAEYNTLIHVLKIDPRLSFAYKTGTTAQVSIAYGTFRQSPESKLLALQPNLASEEASHYILNFQQVKDERTFRVEGYYKRYTNLIKYDRSGQRALNNAGYGFARGIEVFWRDRQSIKDADYWVSYAFLDTKRDYLNFPNEAIPSFASKHNFSAVYKHFIKRIKSQIGFTYSFASGRPYYDPNKELFNSSRTPSYQDLSFNLSYLPSTSVIIYVSCTNILRRENIFGYEFSQQKNEQGVYNSRPVGQPAINFLFAGVFITFSKEKSVNQLPNL